MRKRIARALVALVRVTLAVAAAGVLLAALSHVFVPKNNQKEFGQVDPRAHGVLGQPANSVDALFLGDSEIYTSVSPQQLWDERGISAYVMGTPAQKLCYTRSLLVKALTRQRPRVVVLETNCLFRKVTPGDAILRAAQDAFPVIEYHDRWKSLRLEDLFGRVQATWTDEQRGFVAREGSRAADASSYMATTSELAKMPELNRLYLESIARMCDDAGARLVLLSTPSTKNWNMARHNRVVRLASELGLDYVDLNVGESRVDIDWSTETYDAGDHLNTDGAKKVTSAVGTLLTGGYDLPDRRGGK